jgi:hypothetical protein
LPIRLTVKSLKDDSKYWFPLDILRKKNYTELDAAKLGFGASEILSLKEGERILQLQSV